MQFETSVSEEKKIIPIIASGELNLQDMLDSIGTMSTDPNAQSGYGVIVDLRQVSGVLSLSELRTLVGEHRKYLKLYRGNLTALVLREDEVRRASIMCMLVRPFGIRIEAYASLESAEKYLATGQSWT